MPPITPTKNMIVDRRRRNGEHVACETALNRACIRLIKGSHMDGGVDCSTSLYEGHTGSLMVPVG